MKDVIIIGAGPAAISAGIYCARKKLDTLLISKDFTGQIGLSSWVENYPGFKRVSGLDLVKTFLEHLKSYDIEIKSFESVTDIQKQESSFLITTDESKYETRAVIVCTGAIPKRLGVANEEKYIGKGISYCLTCDEASFEGKTVAVVGGGNAGLEGALELTRFAKKVYIVEVLDSLSADAILIDEVKGNESIEVITSAKIKSFEGEKELEKVIYLDTKEKEEKEILLDGCFVEVGGIPNTAFLKNLVDINEKGEIVVNPKTFQTSIEGIYAAGDVVDFDDKQVVIATGQGAIAALSVFRYIQKKS